MKKYAILGYGTVGGGVARVMEECAAAAAAAAGDEVSLGYILVRRDYPGDPYESRMTRDILAIADDPEVAVVAETMGGTGAAYEYTRLLLEHGKSVVSSNKELVAKHGAELSALARERGVSYLFEASVCGGIPLLLPLARSLSANRIDEVFGIFNGTTNYILTAMASEGRSFSDALCEAQRLGYAEADPTADVEGLDALRKTCILADLAFGQNLDPDSLSAEGITRLTTEDLALAKLLGYRVKLLGRAIRTADGIHAFVAPHLVPETHRLAGVDDVMNACCIRGSAVGETVLSGPGAGRFPTASSVCGDLLEALRTPGGATMNLGAPGGTALDPAELPSRWFVRAGAAPDMLLAVFGSVSPTYAAPGQCGFITQSMTRRELEPKLAAIQAGMACRVLE